jgi:hypothetical protein
MLMVLPNFLAMSFMYTIDLLHFPEHTFDGKKYTLMMIDKFPRLVEIALLSKKSEAAVHLVAVMTRYKTLQNRSVKYLRSDMGLNFIALFLRLKNSILVLPISMYQLAAMYRMASSNGSTALLLRVCVQSSKLLICP